MSPGTSTEWEEAVFTTRWRGNSVIGIDPKGEHQANFEDRENLRPYLPKQTPTWALDPIMMTPLEKTGELRAGRTAR